MQKPTLKRIIIISAIVIAGLLLIPLIIALTPKEYDALKVQNSSSQAVSKISTEDFNTFRTYLIRHLRQQKMIAEDATIDDVAIREDTVKVSSSGHAHNDGSVVSSFLVDIDSVKQTYKITIVRSPEEMTDIPVQINCPHISQMKYPEVECIGYYGDSSKKVEHHLPYETKLTSNEKVIVKSLANFTIQVYLYSCDQKSPKTKETEELIKNWIKEIGDDASLYQLNVRTGYCEGDTI